MNTAVSRPFGTWNNSTSSDIIIPMTVRSIPTTVAATIWRRVLDLEGKLSPTAARALLRVQFSAKERERMHVLSAKARAGTLNGREDQEIDAYEQLGCVLDILHSQARRALNKRRTAS